MKNLVLVLIVVLIWVPSCFLYATIRNVPANYTTIQSAINVANNGDTVLVAPGTYFENIFYRGKGILLSSYFIYNHDTSYISSTIINGSTPSNPDSASCVMMLNPSISSADDTTAVLMGFTITGGLGVKWYDIINPGIYREGGGILIQNWSPRIRYNRIIGNTIRDLTYPYGGGGGIHYGNGNPIIENNVIQNNYGYCGMAICIYGAGGIVRNNIITGNYGGQSYGSGAIYTFANYQSYPVIIENNTVVNNSSIIGAGGLRLFNSQNNIVRNNIIWGNTPIQISIADCSPSISYCDIQGGGFGSMNINLNPQFIYKTFYLSPTSPCIDAGDTSINCKDPENPLNPGYALLPALGTVRNDMGAFGGPHCTVIGSPVIGIKENGKNSIVSNFTLYQNYPNPFNPVTTISYDLPVSGLVVMKIYEVIGKEIRTLVQEKQSTGGYSVIWDGKDNFGNIVSSGIYIYKLQVITAGQTYVKSRKMVLVK